MKKFLFAMAIAVASVLLFAACSSKSGNVANTPTGKDVKAAPIGNLTVTLSTDSGQLKSGAQEVLVRFTDAAGKPVDVGAVSLNFHMPQMGSMAPMNEQATFTTTATPGIYRGKINITMAGEWQAQVAFEGAGGNGKTSFAIPVQ
ncbi:MAG: FixH family protein [Pyrinomonadaceae bacterium]